MVLGKDASEHMADERVIDRRNIFDGDVVHLRVEIIQRSDGQTYQREIIEHQGAVALVPLDEADNVYLVRQYRAAARESLLELPAGALEPGEPLLECARRELQEEVGYYPGQLEELGAFYVAASYTSELITVYLARDLRPSRLEGDIDEDIEVVKMPFSRALDAMYNGTIRDGKTVVGLVWAARRIGIGQ
jgi:ADP-ribose pyrophosphatase